jgi:hypothetical protein
MTKPSHTTYDVTPEVQPAYERLYAKASAADVDAVRTHEWKAAYRVGLEAAAKAADKEAQAHRQEWETLCAGEQPGSEIDAHMECMAMETADDIAEAIRALKGPTTPASTEEQDE